MDGSKSVQRFEALVAPQELRNVVHELCSATGLVLKGARKQIHVVVEPDDILDPSYWQFSLSLNSAPANGLEETFGGSIVFGSPSCIAGYLNLIRARQQLSEQGDRRMQESAYFGQFKKLVFRLVSRNHFVRLVRLDQSAYRSIKVTHGAASLTQSGWKVADGLAPNSRPQEDYVVEYSGEKS